MNAIDTSVRKDKNFNSWRIEDGYLTVTVRHPNGLHVYTTDVRVDRCSEPYITGDSYYLTAKGNDGQIYLWLGKLVTKVNGGLPDKPYDSFLLKDIPELPVISDIVELSNDSIMLVLETQSGVFFYHVGYKDNKLNVYQIKHPLEEDPYMMVTPFPRALIAFGTKPGMYGYRKYRRNMLLGHVMDVMWDGKEWVLVTDNKPSLIECAKAVSAGNGVVVNTRMARTHVGGHAVTSRVSSPIIDLRHNHHGEKLHDGGAELAIALDVLKDASLQAMTTRLNDREAILINFGMNGNISTTIVKHSCLNLTCHILTDNLGVVTAGDALIIVEREGNELYTDLVEFKNVHIRSTEIREVSDGYEVEVVTNVKTLSYHISGKKSRYEFQRIDHRGGHRHHYEVDYPYGIIRHV